jgi:hypothetical protein
LKLKKVKGLIILHRLEYGNVGNQAQRRGYMGVLAFSTILKDGTGARGDWRAEYFGFLNDVLDKMEGVLAAA